MYIQRGVTHLSRRATIMEEREQSEASNQSHHDFSSNSDSDSDGTVEKPEVKERAASSTPPAELDNDDEGSATLTGGVKASIILVVNSELPLA